MAPVNPYLIENDRLNVDTMKLINISTFSRHCIIDFVWIIGKSLLLKEGAIREVEAIEERIENLKSDKDFNDSMKGNFNFAII